MTVTRELLQTAFSEVSSGQQSLDRYRKTSDVVRLTHEQLRIVNHNIQPGETIKIIAFAGTGKTTTLVNYTQLRPHMNFLNVAYNKSVQVHAEKVFPDNVKSVTVHSLAFRAVGFKYKAKFTASIRYNVILGALPQESANYLHSKRVKETIENFIASKDERIDLRHVPPKMWLDGGKTAVYYESEEYKLKCVTHATEIWQRMSNPSDVEMKITHDGYLKLYQLSKPQIFGYDCILIDEAQDCTPAVSDILLSQMTAKILVGDPHQQIYGFRGAKNAMAEVSNTHIFYLTQSFRFGPEIAYVACSLLGVLKNVKNKTLVGGAKPGGIDGDKVGQLAIISRCNYTLFNEAVQVCCAPENHDQRVGFAGGLKGYGLDMIEDIYRLLTKSQEQSADSVGIKDKFIRCFKTFNALKTFAKAGPEPELLGKIKIVERHSVNLPERIAKIRSKNITDIDKADIVFSTAHKSKGLEFDTVKVTDDFLASDGDQQRCFGDMPEDEKNLLYVAVTRAKKRLILNPTITTILICNREHLVEPVLAEDYLKVSNTIECPECSRTHEFQPDQRPHLLFRKRQIKYGNGTVPRYGSLCPGCSNGLVTSLTCIAEANLTSEKRHKKKKKKKKRNRDHRRPTLEQF